MDENRRPSSPAAALAQQEKEKTIKHEVDVGNDRVSIRFHIHVPAWMACSAFLTVTLAVYGGIISGSAYFLRPYLTPVAVSPPAPLPEAHLPAPVPSIADADFSFCSMSAGSSGCCSRVGFMQGTWPWPGHQLFKGSLPTVYVMYNDKRMVFPRHYELVSWFGRDRGDGIPDEYDASLCRDVVEIPDAMLASIMLGGSVQMKEGTLLKFREDPFVYIVDGNYITFSTIRRVKHEATAVRYFGPDWTTKVMEFYQLDSSEYVRRADLEEWDPFIQTLVTDLTRH